MLVSHCINCHQLIDIQRDIECQIIDGNVSGYWRMMMDTTYSASTHTKPLHIVFHVEHSKLLICKDINDGGWDEGRWGYE